VRGDVAADVGAEADGEAVPAVDGDDRQRQRDGLLFVELRAYLLVDVVGGAGLRQQRQRLAPGERGPLPVAVEGRLSPGGEQVQPLLRSLRLTCSP
jgi:hypothetical protein